MEVFRQLKGPLVTLDFPGITTMTEKQINDLFSAKNRLYLLTWLLEQLYPSEHLWARGVAQKEELAGLLRESGFCTSSNKLQFVEADNSLDLDMQVGIFKKILHTLTLSRGSKETTDPSPLLNPNDTFTLDELHSFLNQDVNIFADSASLCTRTAAERAAGVARCREQIEALSSEIAALEREEAANVDYDTSVKEMDLRRVEHLDGEIISFKECVRERNESRPEKVNFDTEKLRAASSECYRVMRNVTQHLSDLKTISNYSESLSSVTNKNKSANGSGAIKRLEEISEEIVYK